MGTKREGIRSFRLTKHITNNIGRHAKVKRGSKSNLFSGYNGVI